MANGQLFARELSKFRQTFDQAARKYFQELTRRIGRENAYMAQALDYVGQVLLAGGKRLRPFLLTLAAEPQTAKEKKAVLQAALAIELVHIYLLIHDDIIDRGEKRHGMDALQIELGKARKIDKHLDVLQQKHFGDSMALIVGDLVYAEAVRLLAESKFTFEKRVDVLRMLQEILMTTIVGQAQDILIENTRKPEEAAVLKMYANKTARYSIWGPLRLGLALQNGKSEITDKQLWQLALPLGVAFQIQDDLLGLFGDEKKLGKQLGADISEGKQTLVVVKAREKLQGAQYERFRELLGKQNIDKKEIREFCALIKSSGALVKCQQLMREYFQESLKVIAQMNFSERTKAILVGLINYLEARES